MGIYDPINEFSFFKRKNKINNKLNIIKNNFSSNLKFSINGYNIPCTDIDDFISNEVIEISPIYDICEYELDKYFRSFSMSTNINKDIENFHKVIINNDNKILQKLIGRIVKNSNINNEKDAINYVYTLLNFTKKENIIIDIQYFKNIESIENPKSLKKIFLKNNSNAETFKRRINGNFYEDYIKNVNIDSYHNKLYYDALYKLYEIFKNIENIQYNIISHIDKIFEYKYNQDLKCINTAIKKMQI